MPAFNKEQSDMLVGFAKELNDAFQQYSDKLGDKFAEICVVAGERFNSEIKRVSMHGDNMHNSYEMYTDRVIAEVRASEEAAKVRHDAHMKELRIASIATIFAAGCDVRVSVSIINQIEDKINNPE